MNQKLTEAIYKQKIRQAHRSAIVKARQLNEESLYKAFVEPFADIVDAAKLTGQDILSAAKFSLDLLFAFSPEAVEKASAKYDDRHEKIKKKWEPILKKNQEALASGDADIIALVLAPHYYIASEAAMQIWDKADNIYDYLDQSGWRIPLAGLIVGGDVQEPASGGGAKKAGAAGAAAGGKDKSLLQKLAGLFYLGTNEAIDIVAGRLLLEQEAEPAAGDDQKPNLEDALKTYFDETGLDEIFAKQAQELEEIQADYMEEIGVAAEDGTVPPVILQLQVINSLEKATDVDTFLSIIDKAAEKGLDLGATGLEAMSAEIKQTAQKMAQSEEFRQQAAQQKGGQGEEVPDISDEEALTAAEKVVFVNAKKNFDEQLTTGKPLLLQKAMAALQEKEPTEAIANALMTTPGGKELLQDVQKAKEDLQAAAASTVEGE